MMCVGMEDPGLIVLPTHRLFRGLPADDRRRTGREAWADCFTTRPAGEGPDLAPSVWEDIETGGDQGTLGLLHRRTTAAGRSPGSPTPAAQRMAEVAAEHSPSWQALGVSILHRLVVENLLGCEGSAQADATCTWSRKWSTGWRLGRVSAGGAGHAGHGRPHPHHQHQRRADAGQEHLFLSQAAQRPGHQSAGVGVPRGTGKRRGAFVSGRIFVSRGTCGQFAERCIATSRRVPPGSEPGRVAPDGRGTAAESGMCRGDSALVCPAC